MKYPGFTPPENKGGNMKKIRNERATWGVKLEVTMNIHCFL